MKEGKHKRGEERDSGDSTADTSAAGTHPTPVTSPRESTSLLEWARYFTPPEWVFYTIVSITGLILRWLDLDSKPMHHDESLHGMYGRYFYDWPDQQFYKYDPMLHGPLLYNFYRIIYSTFGLGDWSVRTAVAIPGSLFIFIPFLFRRYLTRTGVLALTAAVALSPTLIYWCRLIHHDVLVLLAMAIMVYGFTLARDSLKSLFVLCGISLHWCTKENIFITLALLLGYIVYEFMFTRFINHERTTCIGALWNHIKRYKLQVLAAFFVSALIFCYFFGAGFRSDKDWTYWKGIVDGLGWGSIPYWLNQHNIERIKGEFLFHFYLHSWYELPFIIALIYQAYLFYKNGGPITRAFAGLSWAIGIVLGLTRYATDQNIEQVAIWKFFNLKDSFDLVGLFVLAFHSVIVTSYHLRKGEKTLAFWGYIFTATFFAYSYVGEKVPWLGVYPFVAGFPYLALYFEDYFKKHPVSFKDFSYEKTLVFLGITLILLFCIFYIEEVVGVQEAKFDKVTVLALAFVGGAVTLACAIVGNRLNTLRWYNLGIALVFISCVLLLIKAGKNENALAVIREAKNQNIGFLVSGALLLAAAFIGTRLGMLGTYNLSAALFLVFCLYNLRASILTNFTYSGEGSEFIGQVHTTKEFHEVALRIKNEIVTQNKGYKPLVLAEGEPVWPITWYLRDLPEYKFTATKEEWKNFTYLFIDYKEDGSNIPPGFQVRKLNLRGWWVPDQNQFTLKKFLNYSLNHRPWSPAGYSYCTMLTNPNVSAPAAAPPL